MLLLRDFALLLLWASANSRQPQANGIGLQDYVDEPNSETTRIAVRSQLIRLVKDHFPEIEIIALSIDSEDNALNIEIICYVVPTGEEKTIALEFELE